MVQAQEQSRPHISDISDVITRNMASSKQTAVETLALLEERMRRVDYILNGDSEARDLEPAQTTGSATARLRALERTLAQLPARSPAAAEILALQKAYPSLFHPASADARSSLPSNQLAALVLAHTQLYTFLSTSLTQLRDTHVPDPAPAVKLVELASRIEKARLREEKQARKVAELRARSARVVEHWLEDGMLGMSERWADWEERLRATEVILRRREAARKREMAVT